MKQFSKIENTVHKWSLSSTVTASKIIQKKDIALLSSWVWTFKYPKFELLYRGSQDGFSAANFHTKCDNKGPTVVIIKFNHGKVFGGFTDTSWDSSGGYKNTKNAFLFSIDRQGKYNIKPEGEYSAVYNNSSYGPTFGGGHDLYNSF